MNMPRRTTPPKRLKTPTTDFPVVGIGASAGGLEAFTQFLHGLPADTGFAFVFIQHLDPHYKSMLCELLGRVTAMPVLEASDALQVLPNHVYVIPPNANLAILHGALHLMPRGEDRGPHLTIDFFFNSLARDKGSKAIGVILSGTASDGVFGLKAIKSEGGITFSQDEQSARYEGMPHSAIAAGCVDFVMSPEKIAEELVRLSKHPYIAQEKAIEILPGNQDDLGKIFILLRRQSGVDFTFYKPATIERRVKRRMLLLHRTAELSEYVTYLQSHPDEVEALYYDLLINVTTFFRDPDAYAALKEEVFPQIMRARRQDAPIRIWVPGCSTGEEVYSIAISLFEFLGDNAGRVQIQIFATDIDGPAIDKARQGNYGEGIAEYVSPERLGRFFVKTQTGYQISQFIRDTCIFAKQNVFKDPPFSRLDLVSCRNLLIYFGPVLQKKVFAMFHYALKPTGFLFLGSAETIGEFSDLYAIIDQKNKIYAKKSIAASHHVAFHEPDPHPHAFPDHTEKQAPPTLNRELHKVVDKLLIDRFAPPGVVINERMEILQFRGKTGPFIEPMPGEASLNLLKMAKTRLQMPIRTAVMEAVKSGEIVRKEEWHVDLADRIESLAIEVIPVRTPQTCYLVLFDPIMDIPKRSHAGKTSEMAILQHELAATREYLQSVIEQQEVGNEELRSANEEIQSSNEELQSINEELETAKEELQSVNEELATANDELESRNNELSLTNNDLVNLIKSVNIPLMIVGPDLRIRRLSPVTELLNLGPQDIGRSIDAADIAVPAEKFTRIIRDVMKNALYQEVELQDHGGHWYSLRVQPYITANNKIDGAVAAFIDIDAIKRGLDVAKDAQDYAEAIIAAVKYPLMILDNNLRVISASDAYYSSFAVSPGETVDNLLYRLGNGQWAIPKLRALLEAVLTRDENFDNYVIEHDFEHLAKRTVSISGRKIPSGLKRPALILMQLEFEDNVK